MSASYPTAVKSFATRSAGQTITSALVNDLQDEVNAIETNLLAAATSYTPTWGNSGTANTLGNATISGKYQTIGKLVFFQIDFVFGSTSVAGNGTFTFTIPATAAASAGGTASGIVLDASVGAYAATGRLLTTGTIDVFVGAVSNGVTSSSPMTWATDDAVHLTGWYFSA